MIDFCPDGRTVLVTGTDGSGYKTFRVDLDHGGEQQVPIASSRAVCVGTGDVVYVRRAAGQRPQVLRRSLTTGIDTILYDGPVDERHLARSRDGSRIAFVTIGATDARLIVMPSAGGQALAILPAALTPGSPIPLMRTDLDGVVWLPSGNELLVWRRTAPPNETDGTPQVAIWRVPLGGPAPAELARMRLPAYEHGFYGSWNYTLHPNGTRIAFERHAGLVNQYWAIDNLLAFIRSGRSVAVPDVPR
jgi:Tol biopolymer transport system component